MAMTEAACEIPDAYRSLMRDERVYSTSPLWRFSVSPHEVVIGPRSLWKLGTFHFVFFAALGIALYGTKWFSVPGDIARFCAWAAWFCWFMAAAFLGGTFLFEKFRSRKAWLTCRPLERMVSCPRLDKVFTIDQIYALQLIRGKATRPNPEGRTVITVTQLNLIVEENGRLERYPLIGDYGPRRLSRHTEDLSLYCGFRLLKDKAPSVADWS